MARNHFNPAEFRHDSLHEIQQLQRRNSDFAVTNFGEFPRANNQITNICSPDGDNKPILPTCRLVNGADLGAKISKQVAQSIAQTWEQIDLSGLIDLYDKRGTRIGDRHKGPGKHGTADSGAPPLHDSYQESASDGAISSQDMPPSEVRQNSTQGGAQGGTESSDSTSSTDNAERSYSEITPIHTGNPTDLTIAGPPTISAQTIDSVLAAHNSPAAGSGQEIFDRCIAGGIDPAIALAFFACESTFGTDGIAVDTKSWGNIRSTDGSGGFKSYPSYMDGLQDWIDLINNLYVAPPEEGGFGFTTADEALTKYAPPSENDTNAYANKVATLVSEWRAQESERLDKTTDTKQNSLSGLLRGVKAKASSIADTAASLLGQSLWTNSPIDVNGGVWGCAASVSEALVDAGAIDRAEYSAGVYGVEQLLSTPLGESLPGGQPGTGKGWIRVDGPVPGAVVCGYRWDRPGAGDGAHIGIVGPDGQTIYNNHSDSLVWSADPLSSFSSANYPNDVAYYVPPDTIQ